MIKHYYELEFYNFLVYVKGAFGAAIYGYKTVCSRLSGA